MSNYTIESRLGAGGMGEVFRATDQRTGCTVALKIFSMPGTASPTALARFHREVKLCASLDHPGIVKIFDSGEQEGRPFFTMEIVEGSDLDRLTQTAGALDLDRALDIIGQAADAVAYIHGRGLCHRDIKPANLMLTVQGKVKLMDFGLARAETSTLLTKEGSVLGTPRYLAPEALLGKEPGPGQDVWALALTLHELLVGHVWCKAASMRDQALLILKAPMPNLAELRPGTPRWLIDLQAAALERDPALRIGAEAYRDSLRLRAFDPDRQPTPAPAPPPEDSGSRGDLPSTQTATPLPPPRPRSTVGRRTGSARTVPAPAPTVPPVAPDRRPGVALALGALVVIAWIVKTQMAIMDPARPLPPPPPAITVAVEMGEPTLDGSGMPEVVVRTRTPSRLQIVFYDGAGTATPLRSPEGRSLAHRRRLPLPQALTPYSLELTSLDGSALSTTGLADPGLLKHRDLLRRSVREAVKCAGVPDWNRMAKLAPHRSAPEGLARMQQFMTSHREALRGALLVAHSLLDEAALESPDGRDLLDEVQRISMVDRMLLYHGNRRPARDKEPPTQVDSKLEPQGLGSRDAFPDRLRTWPASRIAGRSMTVHELTTACVDLELFTSDVSEMVEVSVVSGNLLSQAYKRRLARTIEGTVDLAGKPSEDLAYAELEVVPRDYSWWQHADVLWVDINGIGRLAIHRGQMETIPASPRSVAYRCMRHRIPLEWLRAGANTLKIQRAWYSSPRDAEPLIRVCRVRLLLESSSGQNRQAKDTSGPR